MTDQVNYCLVHEICLTSYNNSPVFKGWFSFTKVMIISTEQYDLGKIKATKSKKTVGAAHNSIAYDPLKTGLSELKASEFFHFCL